MIKEKPGVLLVEDDAAQRAVAQTVLEDAGFAVFTAGDVDGALRLLKSPPSLTAAVVDVRMPGIDGPTLAEALQLVMPGLPIVMMTGDPLRVMNLRQSPLRDVPVLVKPFLPEELLAALKPIVAAHPAPPGVETSRSEEQEAVE